MALPQKRSQTPPESASRKDPPQRALEGYHSTNLVNPDPTKKYVFAYKGDPDTGVQLYEHLGFVPVVAEEGGVRMAIKRTPIGEVIEYRGHVLMAGDKAELQSQWEYMQRQADEQQNAIIKNRGGIDPLRGLNRGVLSRGELRLVNETTDLETE